MSIYFINVMLIIYWWSLYSLINSATFKNKLHKTHIIGEETTKESVVNKILILFPFIQIFLILALKSETVGTDTMQYSLGFKEILYYTHWQDIFNFKIDHLVFNFERGFILLSKLITLLTEDFTVYLAILYAIMIYPIYIFIKKNSSTPFFSLILFIAFGYLNFYLSGIRQAMAISIVLLSYEYIVKRKIWKFIVVVFIATLFHSSAAFFIPAYFLVGITITPLVGVAFFTLVAITYVFRFAILGVVTRYIYSGTTIGDTGAYTLLFIVLMTFIIGILFYKKVISMNKNNKLIYNLIAVAVLLMVFNTALNYGIRVANYYYIFMILFIPNIISSFKDTLIRHAVVVIVVIFTLAYYFRTGVSYLNGSPYSFFWQ